MLPHIPRTLYAHKSLRVSLVAAAFVFATQAGAEVNSFQAALGGRFSKDRDEPATIRPRAGPDTLHRWNQIANDASGVDHTPPLPGETRVFGEQLGPCRSGRAMAIVHIAMADAVSAIRGGFRSYTGVRAKHRPISIEAAIAQAAHDTLVALFPSQASSFDEFLEEDLLTVGQKSATANGRDLGARAAAAILAMRKTDGSEKTWSATAPYNEPKVGIDHLTVNSPGHWQQDPVSLIPLALGAHWAGCLPFVLKTGDQFRLPPPPALDGAEYTAAYNEVKTLGGDDVNTPTSRTPEQTFIGIFWAYDGTPSLCAPPRLYNQIAVQIADQKRLDVVQLARLLALVNVAMADAGLASWESKWVHDFWRPITGIREGANDGNPDTTGDASFSPLGAPASNLTGPNFTPPFPAYPSGHATFGAALFQTLRRFFGTDRIPFRFVSDEFNGVTKDNQGKVRPLMPRYFTRLSEAEEENGQSRIYLGIHWSFDKTDGIAQGRKVADYVYEHAFADRRARFAGVERECRRGIHLHDLRHAVHTHSASAEWVSHLWDDALPEWKLPLPDSMRPGQTPPPGLLGKPWRVQFTTVADGIGRDITIKAESPDEARRIVADKFPGAVITEISAPTPAPARRYSVVDELEDRIQELEQKVEDLENAR